DNSLRWGFTGDLQLTYGEIKADLEAFESVVDKLAGSASPPTPVQSAKLAPIVDGLKPEARIDAERAEKLATWLREAPTLEQDSTESARRQRLMDAVAIPAARKKAIETLKGRLPLFVFFNNYFRVRPLIFLEHLAQKVESGVQLEEYDYGNACLLKFLG